MLHNIDSLLNRITMYRLVLYCLVALVAIAALFGAAGILPYSSIDILFSAAVLLGIAWATNTVFAWAFNAHPNVESVYITALILALIITPVAPHDGAGMAFLAWAAVWAMASKYIFAIRKKHVFNPAAIAVVITAFTLGQSASWWACSTLSMLGFVVVGGLLITRKIQRFDAALAFIAATLATTVLTITSDTPLSVIQKTLLHAPVFFFAFIMLTEPLTMPPTRQKRILYGALVGILFAPTIHIGSFYLTPELALIAGNILTYCISPKARLVLALKERREIAAGVYHFAFAADQPLRFSPGQYMEWTVPHERSDSRGNRRYFTLASSPTEQDIQLGIKFYEHASSFKQALLALAPGATISAGQLAGEFVLPKNKALKLAWIAGGIGITPFRSMAKYLADTRDPRDIKLLYAARTDNDLAYRDIFDAVGRDAGIKVSYFTEEGALPRGRITANAIASEIPDYKERMFYISGTHAMVTGITDVLRGMGVAHARIKTDFFPGFV